MPKTKKEVQKKPARVIKKSKTVKDLAEKLLSELGLEAKLSVSEEDENALKIQLETDNPGMLIGFHGETLSSLQLILGLMVYRQTGEWSRILVNVNDYRERRQENLERIALAAAQRAKDTNEPQNLSPMNSGERRIVHLILSQDESIETESEGEGWQRHVVVRPRSG